MYEKLSKIYIKITVRKENDSITLYKEKNKT